MGDPAIHSMPQLGYVLKKATPASSKHRRPITPTIMLALKRVCRRNLTKGMPRCCGLQRSFVSVGSFIPERSPARPRRSSTLDYILHSQMWLWTAGTPPQLFRLPSRPPRPTCFGRGSPSTSVCPVGLCLVAAVLSYMVARGSSAGPLFHWEDGKFLTQARFVESM